MNSTVVSRTQVLQIKVGLSEFDLPEGNWRISEVTTGPFDRQSDAVYITFTKRLDEE